MIAMSPKKKITKIKKFEQKKLKENGVHWEQHLFKNEPTIHEAITSRRKQGGEFLRIYLGLRKSVSEGYVAEANAKRILKEMVLGKSPTEIMAELFPKKKQPKLVLGKTVEFVNPALGRRPERKSAKKSKGKATITMMEDMNPARREYLEKTLKRINESTNRPLKPVFASSNLNRLIGMLPASKALTGRVVQEANKLAITDEKIRTIDKEEQAIVDRIHNIPGKKIYIFDLQAELVKRIASEDIDKIEGFARIIGLEEEVKKYIKLEK